MFIQLVDIGDKVVGESHVGFVAGFVYCEMTIEGHAHKPDVAHKVEQFVAGGFVGIVGVGGVEHTVVDTELGGVLVESAAEASELTGGEFFIDKDEGVVETATLDEVEMEQRLDFVEEDKRAAGSDAGSILGEIVEIGGLFTDDTVGEIDGAVD